MFFCCFFLFCFCFLGFFCLFWRVEGSGEVARRATSLGPEPSLFVFFFVCFFLCFLFFFCWFLSLFLIEKPCFPPKKWHFCFFQCFPFFLPSLVWPPPFSLSLSLSLSLSFLSSFLLVFPFCFLWAPCCLSLSFLFVSSSLLFHEKNNIKIFNYKVFVHQSFLIFVDFLSAFFFQIPFPYLCFFPDFKFCFLFNIRVFL